MMETDKERLLNKIKNHFKENFISIKKEYEGRRSMIIHVKKISSYDCKFLEDIGLFYSIYPEENGIQLEIYIPIMKKTNI